MAELTIKVDLNDQQYEHLLGVLKPSIKPGPLIEEWLSSLPGPTLEQLWLTASSDYSTPRGDALRTKLIERLHAEEGLW